MARTVQCIKLGKEAEGLDFPPYPGELGQRIWANVSKQAWAGWLKHQTMLVNENRLNLADARARPHPARPLGKPFFFHCSNPPPRPRPAQCVARWGAAKNGAAPNRFSRHAMTCDAAR